MNALAAPLLQPDRVVRVPIDLLVPDPDQPRIIFEPGALEALGEELKAKGGPDQPLQVRSDYVIKDGERRWRAGKLAGLKDLPCLLAQASADEATAVRDWRLDQACVNHHRAALTALDWSHLLKDLVEKHGCTVGELPALLKNRGIDMSRPYISNLMRLHELPEWAKKMIASGVLPAGAGKYILMAAVFPPAIEHLRVNINRQVGHLEPGNSIRADLSRDVSWAFREKAIRLSCESWQSNRPRFAWKTSCADCTKRGIVNSDHFCFDAKCFAKKQADAELKQTVAENSAKPKPSKLSAQERRRRIDARVANLARARTIEQIVTKAPAVPGIEDLRVFVDVAVSYSQWRAIAERRGWVSENRWREKIDSRVAKMNARELIGILIEAALCYDSHDNFPKLVRRYGIDTAKIVKQARIECQPKKTTDKQSKPKRGKKK